MNNTDKISQHRCGHVAIVSKPNVGKSTLLNRLIGQKISITARKPQTTRHHILGINNIGNNQIIYIDSPGIQTTPKNAINRYMNRQAINLIDTADLLMIMIEALKWTDNDELVLNSIKDSNTNKILLINKIDRITDKQQLLPFIDQLKPKFKNMEIIPMSTLLDDDVNDLQNRIIHYLPVSEKLYDSDQITNRSSRFLAAELIREKIIQKLGDELPYESTVTIDSFKQIETILHIHATV